jgi:hypothetical protein
MTHTAHRAFMAHAHANQKGLSILLSDTGVGVGAGASLPGELGSIGCCCGTFILCHFGTPFVCGLSSVKKIIEFISVIVKKNLLYSTKKMKIKKPPVSRG